ncbi:MAG: LLM class flavin-dependent oxidoreductase, partial [Actinobacteria bacterium]
MELSARSSASAAPKRSRSSRIGRRSSRLPRCSGRWCFPARWACSSGFIPRARRRSSTRSWRCATSDRGRARRRNKRRSDVQFGIFVATKIDDWQLIQYAEELGYDRAWIPDSQMIWSDCYATLALAAHNTKRIQLGTGVAIPGTRVAPVTAHSIASIARLAPGRVFLGIGTGHTAMRVMGMDPMKIREFRT